MAFAFNCRLGKAAGAAKAAPSLLRYDVMGIGRFWRKIVRWFAGGRTESDLAAWLDVPKADLKTGPRHYRRFSIPKRNGGTRKILEPNEKLKHIQRRINRRLLRKLPTHPASGHE